MRTDWKIGDKVRINDFADNFVGCEGRVVAVGEMTCDVEVEGYVGAFQFKHLIPLDEDK